MFKQIVDFSILKYRQTLEEKGNGHVQSSLAAMLTMSLQ